MANLYEDRYEMLTRMRNELASKMFNQPHLKDRLDEIDKELEAYDFTKVLAKVREPMTTTPDALAAELMARVERGIGSDYATVYEDAWDAWRQLLANWQRERGELEAENEALKARVKDFKDMVKECVSYRDVQGIARFMKLYNEVWQELDNPPSSP